MFAICAFGNRLLPYVDTVASVWNAVTIVVVLIGLSATAKVGRHSAADTLGYYDTSISGWGGFSFFIGLLPAAYTYAAVGMIASMAEEVRDATVVSDIAALSELGGANQSCQSFEVCSDILLLTGPSQSTQLVHSNCWNRWIILHRKYALGYSIHWSMWCAYYDRIR